MFFIISGEHASNLLGREAACEMGLIARLEEVDAELFGDIGLFKYEPVKIQLDENDPTLLYQNSKKNRLFP